MNILEIWGFVFLFLLVLAGLAPIVLVIGAVFLVGAVAYHILADL